MICAGANRQGVREGLVRVGGTLLPNYAKGSQRMNVQLAAERPGWLYDPRGLTRERGPTAAGTVPAWGEYCDFFTRHPDPETGYLGSDDATPSGLASIHEGDADEEANALGRPDPLDGPHHGWLRR